MSWELGFVQLPTPGDPFIVQLAHVVCVERVPEWEGGGAVLEMVNLSRFKTTASFDDVTAALRRASGMEDPS